jgi:uncharacterized protein YbjT (DUF2867 family)
MSKKAILLGASGLIGSYLLELLLASDRFSSVTVFVRKPLGLKNEKLTEVITDFSELPKLKELITGDIVFSCLGSTKKKTPDLKEYRRIDHDIPVAIAKYAAENHAEQFHLISSLGANPKASNFYSKMKGETEEDIKKAPIPSIHIYQPSLLRGERKEERFFEKLALQITKIVDPLLFGSFKKYRSIAIEKVAQAMFNQSLKEQKGIFTYPSDQIKELV